METNTFEQNMTFRDYVRILFRQKWVIMASVATVMATVLAGLHLQTPIYEARVRMMVTGEQQVQASYYRDLRGGINTIEVGLSRSETVKSAPVLQITLEALKNDLMPVKTESEGKSYYTLPMNNEFRYAEPFKKKLLKARMDEQQQAISEMTPEERDGYFYRQAISTLRNSIEVQPIRDTNLFEITVANYSPELAAKVVNVVSRAYIIFDLQQQLAEMQLKYGSKHPLIRQLVDNIEAVKKDLNGEPIPGIEAMGPGTVKIIEQASPPTQPKGQPKILILGLTAALSLFLGIILAFIFDYLDHTVKSVRDLQEILRLPFLGAIPRRKMWQKPFIDKTLSIFQKTRYFDAYRRLAEQITLSSHMNGNGQTGRTGAGFQPPANIPAAPNETPPAGYSQNGTVIKTVLFTAPDIGQGVSTTTANLGHYFSQHLKMNILLIDGNVRKPSLHKCFNAGREPGLCELLDGQVKIQEVLVKIHEGLSLLPAGTARGNPLSMFGSPKMEETLKQLKKEFDLILIDCADLKQAKDAVALSKIVDGVVLQVNEGDTRRQVILNVSAPLKSEASNIIGTVLNNRTYPIPQFIYNSV